MGFARRAGGISEQMLPPSGSERWGELRFDHRSWDIWRLEASAMPPKRSFCWSGEADIDTADASANAAVSLPVELHVNNMCPATKEMAYVEPTSA